ncbi:MAG TPA: DUF167 domain-containing protein [Noviherbaspirillum sp.]|jgi:uncharacterized protein (TIGR00251 family)|uniref:DUF167 domain-containing protein n=1 Tax=Noviherbaspirillum sp. TaxID=1926288 RepID=UPI002F94BF85
MNPTWCSATAGGLRISVQLAPNAKTNEVGGIHDGALRIRLQAAPIDGKANEALLRFLAERLGVPRSRVVLVHGQTSRRKVVDVQAVMPVEQAEACLLSASRG